VFINNGINKILLFTLSMLFVLSNISFSGVWETKSETQKESNYLSFSIGLFDFIQNNNAAIEGRTEFRFYSIPIAIKPLSGIMANSDGALFLYVGLLYEIPLGSFLYFTPSFSPGIYYKSNSKELGLALNFRSQLEISLKFENNFRFGISFNHISNGTLGSINPGVESLALSAQFPL
jgi:hypothetical protein